MCEGPSKNRYPHEIHTERIFCFPRFVYHVTRRTPSQVLHLCLFAIFVSCVGKDVADFFPRCFAYLVISPTYQYRGKCKANAEAYATCKYVTCHFVLLSCYAPSGADKFQALVYKRRMLDIDFDAFLLHAGVPDTLYFLKRCVVVACPRSKVSLF